MRYIVLAFRDSATNTYSQPFCMAAVGQATRMFSDAINHPKDQSDNMARHPDDFELYNLGYFDDQHARFELSETPELVVRGKDIKSKV